jgi:hypothetical protein
MRLRIAVLLLVVAAWVATPGAFFHFELLRSTPAGKSTIKASPARIQLWFSQVPAAGVSTVTLFNDGKRAEVGKTVINASDKSMYADPVRPLAPGSYVIHWRGAGDDGHVQSGNIAFTIAAR